MPLGTGAERTAGTGRAGIVVEAHADDRFMVRIERVQPADTCLSARASHTLALPVNHKLRRVEALTGARLPMGVVGDGANQVDAPLLTGDRFSAAT